MGNKERKIRLDELLVERGFCESREKAQRLILGNQVRVEGYSRLLKPSTRVEKDVAVYLFGKERFVSRGGEKLAKALREFNLFLENLTFADIGCSTGGFTDCLLQHGVRKVYAVDVGYGQLHESLRQNPKVKLLERVNARYLTPEQIGEPLDGVAVDVSFISLVLLFAPLVQLLKKEGIFIALVKPQFEAGREKVRKGVVRDPLVHQEVLDKVLRKAEDHALSIQGLTFSPLLGPRGNIEFLGYWRAKDLPLTEEQRRSIIIKAVQEAHFSFGQEVKE
ncbi:MAG: TlyA family RNA methyltransferase [Candidatus Caldatribacteriaceae bacterium]